MKRNTIIIFTLINLIGVAAAGGYYKAQKDTYEDIISEKCWLNKTTRDIECIKYIAK